MTGHGVQDCKDPQGKNPQARQHRRLNSVLRAALFRRSCPDTMTLNDYQLGLLSRSEHARVSAHVERCPHCQAELERLMAFVGEPERQTVRNWIAGVGFEWQRLIQAGKKTGKVVIRLVKDAIAPPPVPVILPVRGRGADANDANVHRRIALGPDQTGGLDVQAVVKRSSADQAAWSVALVAQVPSRWPNLAGTLVRVRAGDWQRQATTDADGRVVVDGIPDQLLDLLTIEVNPDPES